MSDPPLFDAADVALILVDLQAGIVGLPLHPYDGQLIVRRCAGLAAAYRRRGATVAYTKVDLDAFRSPDDGDPLHDPGLPPSEASELVPEAGRQPSDLIVTKRGWGAFAATGLDEALNERAIRTIVLGGIATNGAVESTARAAADLGYRVVLVEDAMTSFAAEAHRFAVETIFPMLGNVRGADEVLGAVGP